MPLFRLGAAAALSILSCSAALAGEWTISKIAGRGYLVRTMDAPPEPAAEGQTVPAGVTFATGVRSRAIITDGKTVMAVGPETNVNITRQGAMTSVRQASGAIGLDVETLGKPHLTVTTPYLAAVVKGTNFSVSIGENSAEVSVAHGVVGVTDKKTGKRADVTSGQSASAGAGGMSVGKNTGAKASASLSAQAAEAKANAAGKAGANASENGKANASEAGKANAGANAGQGKGNAGGKGASGSAGNNGNGAGNSGNGNGAGSSGSGAGSGGSSGKGNSGGKGKGSGRGGRK